MFTEAIANQIAINEDTTLKEMKINAYLEATMRELAINIGESELKVMKESGTEEDLAYLTEAAANGAIEKIQKTVKAAIEAFKEFISRIKDRVVKLITTKETKETMKKVEKKIKLNPFLAKKKVQVVDTKKPLKVISKYESALDTHAAKVASGKVKPGDSKKIDGLKSKFQTEYKAAIMGVAAMTTITVAALVAMVNRDMESLNSEVNKVDKDTSASLNKMAECKAFSEETIAEQQAAMAKIVSFRATLGREKSNELVDGLSNKVSVLRKTVAGAVKGKEVDTVVPKDKGFNFGGKKKGKTVKESEEDILGIDDDDIFGESSEDLFNEGDLFEESESEEIFGIVDDEDLVEESSDDLLDIDHLFEESGEDDFEEIFGESSDNILSGENLFEESSENDEEEDLFGESSDDSDIDHLFEESEEDEGDDLFGESSDDSDGDNLFEESEEDDENDDLFGESAGRDYSAEDLLDAIDDII